MLQSMRRHSQSFIIYILFGMLIVVFVFMFGLPNTDSCNPQTHELVAEAGDLEISDVDLRSAVMRAFPRLSQVGEDEFVLAQRQVLYNMVMVYLIADEAEKAGLRVSDSELQAYIVDWEKQNADAPLYIDITGNGTFDKERYQGFLDFYGTTAETYEAFKRRELLARNYLTLLEGSTTVGNGELRAAFDQRNERRTLRFVKLDPSHVKHLVTVPTETEVADYLSKNMDGVKKYYEEHADDYRTPATVHLNEIIVQKNADMLRQVGSATNKSLDAEARYAIVKKAVVDDKADFGEAAELYNEALVYRDNGGDRGVERLENLSRQHREGLDGKKVGDIVTFETDLTFNIVRVQERTEGTETALDKAQNEIARTMIVDAQSAVKLDALAKEILASVKGGTSIDDAVEQALYADMKEPAEPAAEEAAPAAEEAAPAAEEPAPEDAVPGAEEAVAIEAPAVAPAADAGPWVPQGERASVEESIPFNPLTNMGPSWSFIPRIGDAPGLARVVNSLKTPGEAAPEVYTIEQSRVVAVLGELKSGLDEDFADQKERLARQIRAEKSAALLGDWRSVLRLSHPEPTMQPYGPWVQALFVAAQQTGRFKINKSFLGSSDAQIAANQ